MAWQVCQREVSFPDSKVHSYANSRFFLLTSFCLQKEVSAVSSPEGAHTALSRCSCFPSVLVKAERRPRCTPIAPAIGGVARNGLAGLPTGCQLSRLQGAFICPLTFFLLTSFCLQKEVSAVSSPRQRAHTALFRFSCFTSFLVKRSELFSRKEVRGG